MNHDPMCSFQVPTSYCKECDLIARAREDERTRIYSNEQMEAVIQLAASKAYDAALLDAIRELSAMQSKDTGAASHEYLFGVDDSIARIAKLVKK